MDSVWLKRGLLAFAALVAVGYVAAMLMTDRQREPQMQSAPDQTIPQAQAQTQAPQDQMPDTQAEIQQTPEPEEPKPMYEMGIWEGKVAVFLPGTDHPMRITEMPVNSLPTADQEALKERIPVFDAQALASFLEDYGS